MQEKGKICKLCALIKVRIVKSLRSRSFVPRIRSDLKKGRSDPKKRSEI